MNNSYQQIIIGAGFAGVCMAIRLKQAGITDFLILERNPRVGGTWFNNNYPGAACDVESHLYSFSFEPNPDWSRQFSPQQEILQYIEHCISKYELQQYIKLGTGITKIVFDEQTSRWTITTATGETYTAQSVISCTGGLSQPALPDIKGLETFKGKIFHSARWDKSFDLKGKSVAVIGTGASAIQIVPTIAPDVKTLKLYQRTPPWILPKPDKEISSFRKKMYRAFPFTRALYRSRLYWTHEAMALGFVKSILLLKLFSNVALHFLKKSVPNESLRKKLTPAYVMGCKRILLSNDYYPALQRENVEVVTDGIDQVNPTGILTKDGTQRDVDAIVLATGFHAAEGVVAYEIQGKGGVDLNSAWKHGAEAYLGTSVTGFPNLFFIVGPNTGLGHSSMILMIEAQAQYIIDCLQLMQKEKIRSVDVKLSTQAQFNKDIQDRLRKTVWQSGGCHSWYQDRHGKNVALWPGFTFTFMNRTKKIRPAEV